MRRSEAKATKAATASTGEHSKTRAAAVKKRGKNKKKTEKAFGCTCHTYG